VVLSRAAPATLGAELAALVTQVWPAAATGELVTSIGDVPDGYVALERFWVLPNLARPQMLLPERPRIAAAALSTYNALRQPRTRVFRRGAATALRLGTGRLVTGAQLSVCVPAENAGSAPQLSLTHHLRDRLETGPLAAAIGLTNPGPNRKPILQLFDTAGAPVAFAKIGWNPVTRAMVDNEAAALEALATDGVRYPARPQVLLHAPWQERSVLATCPLPLDAAAYPHRGGPPPSLCESPRNAMTVTHTPLGESPYWHTVRQRSDALDAAAALSAAEADALRSALQAAELHAGTAMDFGPWHGDWSFWNLARIRGQLWAWDWEHYAASAPVGFDALHFVFQREFVHRRRSFANALRVAADNVSVQHVVASTLYPLEMYLRAARLYACGAGWNSRFHDGALRWLSDLR